MIQADHGYRDQHGTQHHQAGGGERRTANHQKRVCGQRSPRQRHHNLSPRLVKVHPDPLLTPHEGTTRGTSPGQKIERRTHAAGSEQAMGDAGSWPDAQDPVRTELTDFIAEQLENWRWDSVAPEMSAARYIAPMLMTRFDIKSVGTRGCGTCHRCLDGMSAGYILCATCGNKRCPKANDHLNACTGSNAAGQAGSAYA